MRIAYKYRANFETNGTKRDTIMLSNNSFYAAKLKAQNDPFEGSVALPESPYADSFVTSIKRQLYDAGIYSLSKPQENEKFPCNELLWAHYANSHKGFCIEYDLDVLCSNTLRGFDITDSINVTYQDERPSVELGTDSIFQIRKKVFGTKSIPWKYENEVRLVFAKEGVKPINDRAVTAIYFGLNISYKDRKDIIENMTGKGIDFYQVERIEDSYKLKSTKLLFDFKHEIINKESRPTVDNYMILYTLPNKDKNTLIEFISNFRKNLVRPSNITVVDDMRAVSILNNYKPRALMSAEDIKIQADHWIAYSTFDAPDLVWMYPEK